MNAATPAWSRARLLKWDDMLQRFDADVQRFTLELLGEAHDQKQALRAGNNSTAEGIAGVTPIPTAADASDRAALMARRLDRLEADLFFMVRTAQEAGLLRAGLKARADSLDGAAAALSDHCTIVRLYVKQRDQALAEREREREASSRRELFRSFADAQQRMAEAQSQAAEKQRADEHDHAAETASPSYDGLFADEDEDEGEGSDADEGTAGPSASLQLDFDVSTKNSFGMPFVRRLPSPTVDNGWRGGAAPLSPSSQNTPTTPLSPAYTFSEPAFYIPIGLEKLRAAVGLPPLGDSKTEMEGVAEEDLAEADGAADKTHDYFLHLKERFSFFRSLLSLPPPRAICDMPDWSDGIAAETATSVSWRQRWGEKHGGGASGIANAELMDEALASLPNDRRHVSHAWTLAWQRSSQLVLLQPYFNHEQLLIVAMSASVERTIGLDCDAGEASGSGSSDDETVDIAPRRTAESRKMYVPQVRATVKTGARLSVPVQQKAVRQESAQRRLKAFRQLTLMPPKSPLESAWWAAEPFDVRVAMFNAAKVIQRAVRLKLVDSQIVAMSVGTLQGRRKRIGRRAEGKRKGKAAGYGGHGTGSVLFGAIASAAHKRTKNADLRGGSAVDRHQRRSAGKKHMVQEDMMSARSIPQPTRPLIDWVCRIQFVSPLLGTEREVKLTTRGLALLGVPPRLWIRPNKVHRGMRSRSQVAAAYTKRHYNQTMAPLLQRFRILPVTARALNCSPTFCVRGSVSASPCELDEASLWEPPRVAVPLVPEIAAASVAASAVVCAAGGSACGCRVDPATWPLRWVAGLVRAFTGSELTGAHCVHEARLDRAGLRALLRDAVKHGFGWSHDVAHLNGTAEYREVQHAPGCEFAPRANERVDSIGETGDEDSSQNLMLMQVPLSVLESYLWQCAQVVCEPKSIIPSSDSPQSSAEHGAQSVHILAGHQSCDAYCLIAALIMLADRQCNFGEQGQQGSKSKRKTRRQKTMVNLEQTGGGKRHIKLGAPLRERLLLLLDLFGCSDISSAGSGYSHGGLVQMLTADRLQLIASVCARGLLLVKQQAQVMLGSGDLEGTIMWDAWRRVPIAATSAALHCVRWVRSRDGYRTSFSPSSEATDMLHELDIESVLTWVRACVPHAESRLSGCSSDTLVFYLLSVISKLTMGHELPAGRRTQRRISESVTSVAKCFTAAENKRFRSAVRTSINMEKKRVQNDRLQEAKMKFNTKKANERAASAERACGAGQRRRQGDGAGRGSMHGGVKRLSHRMQKAVKRKTEENLLKASIAGTRHRKDQLAAVWAKRQAARGAHWRDRVAPIVMLLLSRGARGSEAPSLVRSKQMEKVPFDPSQITTWRTTHVRALLVGFLRVAARANAAWGGTYAWRCHADVEALSDGRDSSASCARAAGRAGICASRETMSTVFRRVLARIALVDAPAEAKRVKEADRTDKYGREIKLLLDGLGELARGVCKDIVVEKAPVFNERSELASPSQLVARNGLPAELWETFIGPLDVRARTKLKQPWQVWRASEWDVADEPHAGHQGWAEQIQLSSAPTAQFSVAEAKGAHLKRPGMDGVALRPLTEVAAQIEAEAELEMEAVCHKTARAQAYPSQRTGLPKVFVPELIAALCIACDGTTEERARVIFDAFRFCHRTARTIPTSKAAVKAATGDTPVVSRNAVPALLSEPKHTMSVSELAMMHASLLSGASKLFSLGDSTGNDAEKDALHWQSKVSEAAESLATDGASMAPPDYADTVTKLSPELLLAESLDALQREALWLARDAFAYNGLMGAAWHASRADVVAVGGHSGVTAAGSTPGSEIDAASTLNSAMRQASTMAGPSTATSTVPVDAQQTVGGALQVETTRLAKEVDNLTRADGSWVGEVIESGPFSPLEMADVAEACLEKTSGNGNLRADNAFVGTEAQRQVAAAVGARNAREQAGAVEITAAQWASWVAHTAQVLAKKAEEQETEQATADDKSMQSKESRLHRLHAQLTTKKSAPNPCVKNARRALDRVTKRDCSRASALVSQMKQRELRVMNKLNIADQPAHDKARMEERVAAAASAIKASRAAAGKAAADARAASQDAAASLESAAQASATRAAAAEARAHLGLGDPAEQKDKLSIESAANAADFVTKMKGIQQKHKTIRLEAEEKNRLAKLGIKHKKRTEVEHALSLIVSEVERVALKERGRMRAQREADKHYARLQLARREPRRRHASTTASAMAARERGTGVAVRQVVGEDMLVNCCIYRTAAPIPLLDARSAGASPSDRGDAKLRELRGMDGTRSAVSAIVSAYTFPFDRDPDHGPGGSPAQRRRALRFDVWVDMSDCVDLVRAAHADTGANCGTKDEEGEQQPGRALLPPIHACVEVDAERASVALKSRGADPAEWDEAVVTLGVEHVARLLTPHLRLAVSAAEPLSSKRNNALDRQVAKAAAKATAKAAAMLDLPATNSSVSQGPTLDTCELRFVV